MTRLYLQADDNRPSYDDIEAVINTHLLKVSNAQTKAFRHSRR